MTSQQKIVQYLSEARASEDALIRILQSQIAMTPRGSYRSALETHLTQTRDHSKRVADVWASSTRASTRCLRGRLRRGRRRTGDRPRQDSLRPAARHRWRGEGAQERQGRLRHRGPGDRDLYRDRAAGPLRSATTRPPSLAASIRADEEKMLQRVLREIPKLSEAVARGGHQGQPSYDPSTTAPQMRRARPARRPGPRPVRRPRRQADGAPGPQGPGSCSGRGSGQGSRGLRGGSGDPRYDQLTAEEITSRLGDLSQIDLAKIDSYERKNENRRRC